MKTDEEKIEEVIDALDGMMTINCPYCGRSVRVERNYLPYLWCSMDCYKNYKIWISRDPNPNATYTTSQDFNGL